MNPTNTVFLSEVAKGHAVERVCLGVAEEPTLSLPKGTRCFSIQRGTGARKATASTSLAKGCFVSGHDFSRAISCSE
jgi:hypothetical protein